MTAAPPPPRPPRVPLTPGERQKLRRLGWFPLGAGLLEFVHAWWWAGLGYPWFAVFRVALGAFLLFAAWVVWRTWREGA